NGTGVVLSSVTSDSSITTLTVQALNPDTTYWLKLGSLWNGGTSYTLTVPQSTSTLTNYLTPSMVSVSSTSLTAGWPSFSVGSGTNTAQGYRLEAYSDSGYTSLMGSSVTADASVSTLTISGLTPYTPYYLRAGAINWDNVVN